MTAARYRRIADETGSDETRAELVTHAEAMGVDPVSPRRRPGPLVIESDGDRVERVFVVVNPDKLRAVVTASGHGELVSDARRPRVR